MTTFQQIAALVSLDVIIVGIIALIVKIARPQPNYEDLYEDLYQDLAEMIEQCGSMESLYLISHKIDQFFTTFHSYEPERVTELCIMLQKQMFIKQSQLLN